MQHVDQFQSMICLLPLTILTESTEMNERFPFIVCSLRRDCPPDEGMQLLLLAEIF